MCMIVLAIIPAYICNRHSQCMYVLYMQECMRAAYNTWLYIYITLIHSAFLPPIVYIRVRYLLSATMYYRTLNLLDHRTNQLTFSTNCSTDNTKTDYSKTRRTRFFLPWREGLKRALRKYLLSAKNIY